MRVVILFMPAFVHALMKNRAQAVRYHGASCRNSSHCRLWALLFFSGAPAMRLLYAVSTPKCQYIPLLWLSVPSLCCQHRLCAQCSAQGAERPQYVFWADVERRLAGDVGIAMIAYAGVKARYSPTQYAI